MSSLNLPGRGVASSVTEVPATMSSGLRYAKEVIAQFDVKSMSHVPPYLDNRLRPTDNVQDKQYKLEAQMKKRPDLARFGRIRNGRIDTGFPFTPQPGGVPMVQAAFLRTGLANVRIQDDKDPNKKSSFYLDEKECHWYQRVKTPKASQHNRFPSPITVYSTVIKFVRCTPEEAAERYKYRNMKTIEQIRFLAGATWNYGHGWSNPLDENIVLHFTGCLIGQKPKHAVRVQEKFIVFTPVTTEVKEDEEFDPTSLPQGMEADDLLALSERQLATVGEGGK
jgi:hypothetical protein